MRGPSSPLDHFRSSTPRQRLHPRELLLLGVVSAHLVLLPWALGGMPWWSEVISLGLSAIGFAIALLPRDYSGDLTSGASFRLLTFPKLLRFPIFWAGLALLVYILVQALNPAWVYVEKDRHWWMLQVPHIDWLPSGTKTPFLRGSPWRSLIVYSSAWLLVCSIWIGFTRRRSLQRLLTIVVGNGILLAVFALAQRLMGNGRMFWFWRSPNDSFFGSFIYKNHAGAYLLLTLVISVALAAWFHLRGLRRMEKSNPSGVFLFFAALLAVSIIVSYARGATLFTLTFLVLAVMAHLLYQWRGSQVTRKPVVSIILLLGLALFTWAGLNTLAAEKAWNRMGRLFSGADVSVRSREIATAASWEMVKDHWQLGTGAGSFQFLFTRYQQRYPEILAEGKRRMFWNHAHNDFMEIPLELGIFGVATIAFCCGFWAWRLSRSYFWENPIALIAVIGGAMLMAHAWTDFLFFNPAILLTWCALWPIVTQWTEYEERGLRP